MKSQRSALNHTGARFFYNSNHDIAIRKGSIANNFANFGHEKNPRKKMAKIGHDFIAVYRRPALGGEAALGTNTKSSTPPP